MNKLNIDLWREYYIKDLFVTEKKGNELRVPTGASVSSKELEDGDIPKISVSGYNNGIVGYFSSENKNFRVYNNFISVSFLGSVFYHDGDAFLDMKVHCLKPLNFELNEYSGTFLATVIKESLKKFYYGDQISSAVLPHLKIKLPVNKNNELDLDYITTFMKKIYGKAQDKIFKIKSIKGNKTLISTNDWKRFNLYDENLFEINSGNKFDKSKMTLINPTINFVGRSTVNNGVTGLVDFVEGEEPYKGGNMTLALGGEHLGSCFIQEKDFYTSQNVNVLIPKKTMSLNVKLFISVMIYRESRMYYKAFEDELNRHIKTDFSILLPVDKNGVPNWTFMDKFIEDILNKSQSKIDLYKTICGLVKKGT